MVLKEVKVKVPLKTQRTLHSKKLLTGKTMSSQVTEAIEAYFRKKEGITSTERDEVFNALAEMASKDKRNKKKGNQKWKVARFAVPPRRSTRLK